MADRNIVMIVDNVKINRIMLKELVKNNFRTMEAEDGEDAKRKFMVFQKRVCCVLYNANMPDVSGTEFLEYFAQSGYLNETPVFIIASDDYVDFGMYYGLGASEVFVAPFDPAYLNGKIRVFSDLYNKNLAYKTELAKLKNDVEDRDGIVRNVLTSVFEFIHFETSAHITRVKKLTNILAKSFAAKFPEYGLTDELVECISDASALHDVGKAAIPTTILFKPGRLTGEEFAEMKTHTVKGVEILNDFGLDKTKPFNKFCFEIARNHHERWDGNGYPDRLSEDDIPVAAQIFSIIDVYDALVSEKVYKDAIPYEKAVTMIREGECGLFPPKVLEAFNDCEDEMRSYLKAALMLKDSQV